MERRIGRGSEQDQPQIAPEWQTAFDAVRDHQLRKEEVVDVINSLTERERFVIEWRFGLEDGRSRTQREIGEELGVHRSTVGRIEQKALKKLRHPTRGRMIRDYLNVEDEEHRNTSPNEAAQK